MAEYGNLVHQTSASTGTGDFTLAAAQGKQTFNDAFGTGTADKFYYFISNRGAAEWEVGTGHLSDAVTLVRDTVLASSNSNSAVSFSAGTKDVSNDIPATARALRSEMMLKADYDPNSVGGDAFDMDDMQDGSSKVAMTTAERSKLTGIEDSADVTDATNVASAGAVMDGDFSSNGLMARTGSGAYASRTITGTPDQISVSNGSGQSGNPTLSLPSAVTTSLGKADTALQPASNLSDVASAATARTNLGLGTASSPQFTGIELGHASDTTLTRLSAGNVGVEGTVLLKGGKHTIQLWPGSFMLPDSGAPEYVKVSATNQLPALAFDTSSDESVWFAFRAPKSSDETAGFTFDYAWSHPSTTTNFGVAMFVELVAVGNGELISASMGTAVELDDTGGTTNAIYHSGESGLVTPGNTWAEGDIIIGRLYRDVSDAFDNLAVDMRLHVFNLYVTLNAGNDA